MRSSTQIVIIKQTLALEVKSVIPAHEYKSVLSVSDFSLVLLFLPISTF